MENTFDLEMLKYACDNGMIDMSLIQTQIEMSKRKEILDKHPFKIYCGSDNNWHTYLPDESRKYNRRAIYYKDRKKLEDTVIQFWKEKENNPTVEEIFTEWNARRLELKKISPGTHQRNVQDFNRYFTELRKRRIKSIDSITIGDFLEEQIPRFELTAKAFSGLKTLTKGILKYAKKKKYIDFNIEEMFYDLDLTDSSFRKVIKEDEEEVFNESETKNIMQYCVDNPDSKNLGILLMFLTGVRVGELVALKFEDFDEYGFKVRRTETRYLGESGKNVYAVKEYPKSEAGIREPGIPSAFNWIIKRLRIANPFGEYVFCNEKGERMTTNCIRRRLQRICKWLNIPSRSPHKIRKTYATILLDSGLDNRIIIKMMGHTHIGCTEKHYHRNRKTREEILAVLDTIPEFVAR